MTIATIRDQFNTALKTIASISAVHDQVPDALGKLPATILQIETIDPHHTLTGSRKYAWRLLLILAKRNAKLGIDDLDPYMESSGVDSIEAALEGATIGDEATLVEIENIGHLQYRDQTVIGAEFIVEVVETE